MDICGDGHLERDRVAQDDSRKDGPLFIVDNSPGGRSGADYLREWCELARSFDIATGFFEIGSLLELDGAWQKLEKIRILMGDELTFRTKKAMLEAVQRRAEGALEKSLDADKIDNPFLEGAPAIVEALASGKIEARVYNRDKFQAKAYITHGKFDVIGSQALVGSSNFTRPGLKQNAPRAVRGHHRGNHPAVPGHVVQERLELGRRFIGDGVLADSGEHLGL